MKTTKTLTILALGLMVCVAKVSEAAPMGTAFTYQGHLYDANDVGNGLYDFQFKLFDNVSKGNQVGSDVNVSDVDVIDALFTVELDFGSDIFDGDARWLEIGVRPGDQNDPNVYTVLSPRQEVTPTPYALYAQAASYAQTAGSDNDWMIDGNDIYSIPSGHVGIGTTNPGGALQVHGAGASANFLSNATSSIMMYDTRALAAEIGGGLILGGTYTGTSVTPFAGIRGVKTNNIPGDYNGQLEFFTRNNGDDDWTDDQRMVITNSGDVGIGTTSPSDKLHVMGDMRIDETSPYLNFYSGASQKGFIGVWTNDDMNVINKTESGSLKFGTNSIERMRIKENGNVGIGTTNPLSKLSVGSDGESGAGVYASGTTYGVYASGMTYGVYAYAGSPLGLPATAVKSQVDRGFMGSGGFFYSGYFDDTGSSGTYLGLYADIRSGGAIDIAEYILDTYADTEAGDVLVADPENDESVIKASLPYDSTVVGIVSTQPHLVMGMELVMNEETGQMYEDVDAAMLALAGRVPVKVTDENGPIKRGDLLTTSSKAGYAMKWTLVDVTQAEDFEQLKSMLAENERRRNAIVGKALGNLDSGDGKIVALVNLQ